MAGKTYYWSSNGKCYHESLACPHLKNVRQPLCGNLQLAKRGGRSPCSHCCTTSYAIVPSVNADQDIDHSVLYVSDGSPLYHISPECNYFKYNKTKYRTTKQGAIASGHIRPCAVCAYSWPVLSDVYYTIPELPLQSSAPAQEPAEENHADSHSEENVEKKKEILQTMGVETVFCPDMKKHVNLKHLMEYLGKENIDSILLEGGGTLNDSALQAGVVQEVQAFIAPKIFGGTGSRTPVDGIGIELPSQAAVLKFKDICQIGEDLKITCHVLRKEQEELCLQEL